MREAMAMIEDMGEALSLSLDDSEEDEERERGDEGVSGLHEAPRSAGKREAPMRGDWDDERGSAKRRRGREATRTTTGRRLHQDLLALEESSSDDEILEASSDDEDFGAGPEPTSSVSLDSRKSDRDVFSVPTPPANRRIAAGSDNSGDRPHYPVGPQLRMLREGQGSNREYYTHDHLRRLREFEARVPWNRMSRGSKTYCSKAHKQPCKACTTCHFCRQKTTDQKTWCPCALKKGRIVGGKSRGILCGFCLEMRFGENLDEALSNPNWRCPSCRDICNCSGANCSRSRRNLFPTNQLYHEAFNLGYRSVAHYLILTHLTDGSAMPMPEVGRGSRPRALAAIDLDDAAENKTATKILRQKTKIRLKNELKELRMEFPPPIGWGIRGLDDQGEEEEEETMEARDKLDAIPNSEQERDGGERESDDRNKENAPAPAATFRGSMEAPAGSRPQRLSSDWAEPMPLEPLAAQPNTMAAGSRHRPLHQKPTTARRAPAGPSENATRRGPTSYSSSHSSRAPPQHLYRGRESNGGHVARSGPPPLAEPDFAEAERPWIEPEDNSRPIRQEEAAACPCCPPMMAFVPSTEGNRGACSRVQADMPEREAEGGEGGMEAAQRQEDQELRVRQVQKKRDEAGASVLRLLQEQEQQDGRVGGEQGEAAGPWHDLLRQVRAVDWETLPPPQRNSRASPIVAKLPTRASIARSASDKEEKSGNLCMTHDELRACSHVLLVLAAYLPERQLVPMVCKKVFGRAPIVDMASIDMRAKAIIFDTSFKILRIMADRKFEIFQAVDTLVSLCAAFLDAQDDLWAALSIKVEIGVTPEVRVGGLVLPAVTNHSGQLERISMVRSSLEANRELILNALFHFYALSASSGTIFGAIFPSVMNNLVIRMLDGKRKCLSGMRKDALGIAYGMLVHLKTKSSDPSFRQEAEIISIIGDKLLSQVNGLVGIHYPIRMKEESGGEASTSASVSEDTVTLAIRLLCQILGFLLSENEMSWDAASSFIFAPYSDTQFWPSANSHYRGLAYKLISTVALGGRKRDLSLMESLLRAWLISFIDPVKGKHSVQMTEALVHALTLGSSGALEAADCAKPSTCSEIRMDKDGSLRASWVTFASKVIQKQADLAGRLLTPETVKCACEYFQAAQREMTSSGSKRKQWEDSACGILVSIQRAYVALRDPRGGSLFGAAPLVDLLARIVSSRVKACASVFLQTREPKPSTPKLGRLESLGLARTQIKRSSLGHLQEVLRDVVRLYVRDHSVCVPSGSLHTILLAVFEHIPGISADREPFMTALYEELASALIPGPQSGKMTTLCHFILGTYVRRWLQKAAGAPKQHAAVAAGALDFLKVLLTQEGMRSETLVRVCFPPLMAPLLECFACSESCGFMCPLQQVNLVKKAFDFLAHVVTSCHHFVPAYATAKALNAKSFPTDMNLLSKVAPMDADKHETCLQVLWQAALQSFLRIVANVLNLNLYSIDQINRSSEVHQEITILTGTVSANTKSKMFRLLGRPRPSGPIDAFFAEGPGVQTMMDRRGEDKVRFAQELATVNDLVTAGFRFALAAQTTDGGLPWVRALMPSLHGILRLAQTRSQHVDAEYVTLWSALDAKEGAGDFALPPHASPEKHPTHPPKFSGGGEEIGLSQGCSTVSDTQETVRYASAGPSSSQQSSQCTQSSSLQSSGQNRAIVPTRDLRHHLGGLVNFFGYVMERDPRTGTRAHKSQKKFVSVLLGDAHGSVKLIAAGEAAEKMAETLDAGSEMGREEEAQILVLKKVRCFENKSNGQVVLQGLSTTTLHLNPRIKAASALRKWIAENAQANQEIV